MPTYFGPPLDEVAHRLQVEHEELRLEQRGLYPPTFPGLLAGIKGHENTEGAEQPAAMGRWPCVSAFRPCRSDTWTKLRLAGPLCSIMWAKPRIRSVSLQLQPGALNLPPQEYLSHIVCKAVGVHLTMIAESGNRHLDRVQAVIEGNGTRVEGSISASWKRSAINFGVDPASNDSPRILTSGELKDHRERAEGISFTAREELDQLYRISCPAGYVALMSNEHGILIDHRVDEAPSSHSAEWGNFIGGVWSEETEGTNGTGTCIAERRPVTIHRSEHFRFRHIGSSCSAAPIFGVDDELIGVLDISSTDPTLSENAHKLAGALVIEAARSIEERNFREQFRRHWIVAIASALSPGRTALMAVDKDRQIVGMDHNARISFARTDAVPGIKVGFWTLFERDEGIFRARSGGSDLDARLILAGATDTLAALVTPPEPSAAIWRNAESTWLHCRPRRLLPTNVSAFRHSSGGLPPRVLRRVREYIDSHLSETLELKQLALTAGLSLYHFARAFKESAGVPPHRFVVQRRIALACELLISTDRPIADVAFEVGFAGESHLARHFRQSLGVSPGAFRRSHR